ncbi:STAS/SEC14 domain-containing protein [Paracoccus sp. (in: a-proteobacteria)]|uniref:STAS/SEC14 domain-containing protein n=1 Tax=Paracoccus sp. TaxID=267 RepID=UPI00321FDC2D
MLGIEIDKTRNVIIARPEGSLPAADFRALGTAIDDYAAAEGHMPGLVVFLKGVPQWDGFAALQAHFEMLRRHAAVLPRVAVVTDRMGLSFMPGLADLFVQARVRHFDTSERDKALLWAGAATREPEGYLLLEDFPDNVIAIRAVGEVTSRDYEERLIPLVRDRAARHGKLRLLMQLGPDFERYSAGAIWDDARLGLTYWRSFERVAVVSDIAWITGAMKVFAPLMPSEVAIFPNDALEAARVWICADAPA